MFCFQYNPFNYYIYHLLKTRCLRLIIYNNFNKDKKNDFKNKNEICLAL